MHGSIIIVQFYPCTYILHILYTYTYRRAARIKPLQPDLMFSIGQVAGMAHDDASMHAALQGAMHILDSMDRADIAPLTLASMYHKLSHAYLEVKYIPCIINSALKLSLCTNLLHNTIFAHFE